MNGYFEENNKNKYFRLVSANTRNEEIKKYEELWIEIRDFIKSITKNSDNYDKKYIKIKFNSDNKLLLNKTIEIPKITIVVRAVFDKNNKYYPHVFFR